MDQMPTKNEATSLLLKILPPLILSIMTKIASDIRRGRRVSFLSTAVIVTLAACGAILGYWITIYLGWKEIKMTLTIFFFGIFADKFFEYIFSKTFLNAMFNYLQDMITENMRLFFKSFTTKKD